MPRRHVLFRVWLSSLAMQVGGSGGRSPPGKQGGFGRAASPPTAGGSGGDPGSAMLGQIWGETSGGKIWGGGNLGGLGGSGGKLNFFPSGRAVRFSIVRNSN